MAVTTHLRHLVSSLVCCLMMATPGYAELLVYEPFDYKTVNDEQLGRLDGRNGGLGFAEAWADTATAGGHAFIYDQAGNPEARYGGNWGEGKPDWDGEVDNLPTMGGYMAISDWDLSGDGLHSTRKLVRSAGEMAEANRGVLWLSAVWHMPHQHFFAPVGIALASNHGGFKDRALIMNDEADAIGVGNGRNFRDGRKRLNPIVWKKGEEVAGTNGTNVDSKKDNIIILKYEFGETDKISTWYFTEDQEITELAFNRNAISASAAIDEDTLDVLTLCTTRRGNAIDEIRIGTDFRSVISGSIPERQEVKIKRQLYDQASDRYYLEWTSNPGEFYGIYIDGDAGGYRPCIAAAVEAWKDQTFTSYGPFANPFPGNARLKFEIGLPDLNPPVIERVWGSGNTVSLFFSEAMLPKTARVAENYAIVKEDGGRIPVTSVDKDTSSGAILLKTERALDPDTEFTITTRNLTDLANLPLETKEVSLRTWDDDPEGIKVFILAGQSNMVGYGHSEMGADSLKGGPGTLRYLALNDKMYPEYNYKSLLENPAEPESSAWKTRGDVKVWWRNGARAKLGGPIGKGDLGPPFRGANEKWFGPEYGFGQVIGDFYQHDDVLIIKASWGGHNLVSNFRPPSAVARRGGEIGASYEEIFKNAHEVLDNLGTVFPEWDGRGYEIVGFAWHQGTSDKSPEIVAEEYKHNLPDLIRDVRAEFGKPDLPFVIATTGMGYSSETSPPPYENYHPVERAQLWVVGVDKPEKVRTDDTRGYNETVEDSPRNQGYHWNQNARSYFRIGLGLGRDMVDLLKP